MTHQDIVLDINGVTKADLHNLFLEFGKVKVTTDEGEAIYLLGVSHHENYKEPDVEPNFQHEFETEVFRNGQGQIFGKVQLSSKDNLTFSGTISIREQIGGFMTESDE